MRAVFGSLFLSLRERTPYFPLSRLRERVGVRACAASFGAAVAYGEVPSPCPLPQAGEGFSVAESWMLA